MCADEKLERRRRLIREATEGFGGRFIEWDPSSGNWVFEVDHFSAYGIRDLDQLMVDSDEEEEGEEGVFDGMDQARWVLPWLWDETGVACRPPWPVSALLTRAVTRVQTWRVGDPQGRRHLGVDARARGPAAGAAGPTEGRADPAAFSA